MLEDPTREVVLSSNPAAMFADLHNIDSVSSGGWLVLFCYDCISIDQIIHLGDHSAATYSFIHFATAD